MSSKSHSPVFAPFFEVRGNLGFGGTIPVPKSSMFYRGTGTDQATVISVPSDGQEVILTTEANKSFDYTKGVFTGTGPVFVVTSGDLVQDGFAGMYVNYDQADKRNNLFIIEGADGDVATRHGMGISLDAGDGNTTGFGGDIDIEPGIGGNAITAGGGNINILLSSGGAGGGTDGVMYILEGGGGGNAVFCDVMFNEEKRNATAANDLALQTGNVFVVSGNTQVNTITMIPPFEAGLQITLIFSGTPTVKHNTAGAGKRLFLAGSADFVAAANSVLGFVYDGTQWQETFRKVA